MKWIEVIHLRSAEKDSGPLKRFLEQFGEAIRKDPGPQKIRLFKRAHLETDVCLQLHHETEQMKLQGSRLGIYLAKEIKRFGMVHHTVWLESELEESF